MITPERVRRERRGAPSLAGTDPATYVLVMYRDTFFTSLFSFLVGVAAIHCGGTSTPPAGGVHASASPASAEKATSADNPKAEADGARGAASPFVTPGAETPSEEAAPTCEGKQCPDDQYCDLQSVRCVRAPCPAVAMCVEGMHPCAVTTCAHGSRCESRDGQAQCIPLESASDGVPCGGATCEPGMVCCNASCGICTPPDGACTQQACE